MMLYDTPEKLHELTGYKRTCDHVRRCQENVVRFMRVRRDRYTDVALNQGLDVLRGAR